MTVLVGLLFLNMSFFLTEVVALDLHKNQTMVENIAKLFAGAANEEEKDVAGSQESGFKTGGEIDILLFTTIERPELSGLSISLAYQTCDGAKPINHFKETVNPPPEA